MIDTLTTALTPIQRARSFLFVPGDKSELIGKAFASGADAVIVDLEDAVLPSSRHQARDAIRQTWPSIADSLRAHLLLRINAAGTEDHESDVLLATELAEQGLGGLMLAKAESRDALRALNAHLGQVSLVPLVESGAGLDSLHDMATVGGVVRFALGHLDLQSDLGMSCGPNEEEIAPARWELLRATRRAQLPPPIDGVTTDFKNLSKVQSDCERSLRMGFGAKLCIHPAQVAAVHAAFSPSQDQLAHAHRILDAVANAVSGACVLDGRMIDAPVIALARRTLEMAR
jgi:citrate lyase subunit beta/citryl-CoA lyase